MIFKDRITHKRYTLAFYSKEKNQVILEDADGRYIMTLEVFYKNYEYVWMKTK